MYLPTNKKKIFYRKVSSQLSTKRILNLIDIAIIDFLIQNGDRHRYEVYKSKIILLDNGKGLGNPMLDELDILAPLYQCCMWVSYLLTIIKCGSLWRWIGYLLIFHTKTTERIKMKISFKSVGFFFLTCNVVFIPVLRSCG